MHDSLTNYYEKLTPEMNPKLKNPKFKDHGLVIPFRCIILGSTGSGKTNLLLNIIHKCVDTFEHIYVCIPTSEEPLYDLLRARVHPDSLTFFEGYSELPALNDLPKHKSALVVFDDLVAESKQKKIEDYYIRGRKNGLSLSYLSQSFYKIPKIIRGQIQYLFIKKVSSERDLNAILREASVGLDKERLIQFYNYCVKGQNSFLLMDIQKANIRCGFKHILQGDDPFAARMT